MPNPRVGDNVYLFGKTQPNGKIKFIDWRHDREVICECHDTHEHVTVEWDSFEGNFNERLNQWVLYEH